MVPYACVIGDSEDDDGKCRHTCMCDIVILTLIINFALTQKPPQMKYLHQCQHGMRMKKVMVSIAVHTTLHIVILPLIMNLILKQNPSQIKKSHQHQNQESKMKVTTTVAIVPESI